MITRTSFCCRPPGSRTPGLEVAILVYFDQYLVIYLIFFLKEIRFIKNIGYYEVIHLPHNNLWSGTWRTIPADPKRGMCNHKTKLLSG